MAIKSKELAGMLGVSTATMSLVLNHKPGISDELRSSLLARIQEMGYGYMIKEEPQELQEGSPAPMKNIAYLVMSDYQDEGDEAAFFPPVIEGAEREARHLGYHFSIIHMYDEKGSRPLFPRSPRRSRRKAVRCLPSDESPSDWKSAGRGKAALLPLPAPLRIR